MSHNYYVYIMTNKEYGTLYIGVTNDLPRRVSEHRLGMDKKCFTYQYSLTRLVYYAHYTNIDYAIREEKRMKRWQRAWKNELIESKNPHWQDLWQEIAK